MVFFSQLEKYLNSNQDKNQSTTGKPMVNDIETIDISATRFYLKNGYAVSQSEMPKPLFRLIKRMQQWGLGKL
jgi:hypothetical protein